MKHIPNERMAVIKTYRDLIRLNAFDSNGDIKLPKDQDDHFMGKRQTEYVVAVARTYRYNPVKGQKYLHFPDNSFKTSCEDYNVKEFENCYLYYGHNRIWNENFSVEEDDITLNRVRTGGNPEVFANEVLFGQERIFAPVNRYGTFNEVTDWNFLLSDVKQEYLAKRGKTLPADWMV